MTADELCQAHVRVLSTSNEQILACGKSMIDLLPVHALYVLAQTMQSKTLGNHNC